MKKTTLLLAVPAMVLAAGCQSSKSNITADSLQGTWIEIMPENIHITQGIRLDANGQASSIGMATLQYTGWNMLDDSRVVFSGKSIGNGQTIEFSDTLDIVSLQGDTLTLGKNSDGAVQYRIQYCRQQQPAMVGTDDASTGYTWSDALQKKIRIFESGARILSATDPEATMAGYVVMSADSAKAEIFLPGGKTLLDRRTRPDGTPVWNVEDDDTYLLEQVEGNWLLSRRGRLLYATTGTENLIRATFTAEDGQEVTAAFYPGVVEIFCDGSYSLLRQYRTASGYGYANPLFDLRGKGQEATLTRLSDNRKTQLKEKE